MAIEISNTGKMLICIGLIILLTIVWTILMNTIQKMYFRNLRKTSKKIDVDKLIVKKKIKKNLKK